MDYAELVQSVIDITDRDELVPQIQYAIAKATLKLHSADLWNRDIVEISLAIDVSLAPRYEIYIQDSLPGFRKIRYINGYDLVTNTVTCELSENSPVSLGDSYGRLIDRVYYLAGDVITLRCNSPALTRVQVGYWKLPVVDAANYRSWIADIAPYAIIDEASVEIFGSVGDDDEAARRKRSFQENVQLIRISDIEAAGR